MPTLCAAIAKQTGNQNDQFMIVTDSVARQAQPREQSDSNEK